jgi:hypothetical protein
VGSSPTALAKEDCQNGNEAVSKAVRVTPV